MPNSTTAVAAVMRSRAVPAYPTEPISIRHRVVGPALVGTVGFFVSVVGSWVPSVWYDEAATVTSATRSWAALGREMQSVDLVHATYYALMHCWFAIVGYSPFALRFPSAVAVASSAALLVLLGRRLAGDRVGLLAGLFFVLLPRVTWMGAEGRSFAIGALLALAATMLLLTATDRTSAGSRSWPWWAAYTAVSVLGGSVFLYLVLVTVSHGLTVFAVQRMRRSALRRPLVSWTVAVGITVLALVPLAAASSRQTAQISWIQHISRHTLEEVLVTQFSYENAGFAVLLWVLVAAGFVVAIRLPQVRPVLAVALPWVAVPTVVLIVASIITHPLYSPRYVAYAAPAAALLMAAPFAFVPARWLRPTVIVAVVLAGSLTAPTWAAQRTITAKDDSGWNQVAALIERQRLAESDTAHDAVLYGPVQRHPKATSRIIAETYPRAFAGLRDPLLMTAAGAGDGLWETQRPLSDAGAVIGDASTVWLLTAVSPDTRTAATRALRPEGFRITDQWKIARTWVVCYER